MSLAENQAAFREVIEEAFNKGNYAVLEKHFNPGFAEHQFGLRPTIEGVRRDIESLRRAFPDFHLTIEDIAADGEKLWSPSPQRVRPGAQTLSNRRRSGESLKDGSAPRLINQRFRRLGERASAEQGDWDHIERGLAGFRANLRKMSSYAS